MGHRSNDAVENPILNTQINFWQDFFELEFKFH